MLTIDISSQNTYLRYTSKHDKVLLLSMQLEDVTRKGNWQGSEVRSKETWWWQ